MKGLEYQNTLDVLFSMSFKSDKKANNTVFQENSDITPTVKNASTLAAINM